MIRALLMRSAALVTGAALVFLGIGPSLFDRLANQVVPVPEHAPTAAAQALLQRLTIIDLHADSLLWRRNILDEINHGHVDYPRLVQGHVALQVFSSVTKTPKNQNYESNSGDTDNITTLAIAQLQPMSTWTSLLDRSLYHAEKLEAAAVASHGKLRIIRTRADLQTLLDMRKTDTTVVGTLLSIEGLQGIERSFRNFEQLSGAGFRMMGLAHFFDNDVAGSVHGVRKYGLTPFGRDVVHAMETHGVMVDVAHASHQSIADVLQMATKPVVFSHGGVKGTCDNNRNLTDAEIRGIARTGGIIGIGYWKTAICDASAKGVARAMTYVRNLVGAQHVALGSDFDGAVQTPFDTSETALVVQALLDAKWTEADIAAAMGGNAVRVFMASLPAQ